MFNRGMTLQRWLASFTLLSFTPILYIIYQILYISPANSVIYHEFNFPGDYIHTYMSLLYMSKVQYIHRVMLR